MKAQALTPKKRSTLAKHTISTSKDNASGRVAVDARLRELVDPRPSEETLKRIERLENSTARMQQRLGFIKLS